MIDPAALFLAAALSLGGFQAQAFEVIADTDAAPDDLRAICMLAAMEEVSLLAVTCCDGSCSPEVGLVKARALLEALGLSAVATAAGAPVLEQPPPWRGLAAAIPWGTEGAVESSAGESAPELLARLIGGSRGRVTVICLGPLTNLAAALSAQPDIAAGIRKVIWYNDEVAPPAGFNYEADSAAADLVLASGLRIDVVSNASEDGPAFDTEMLRRVEACDSVYARALVSAHRCAAALEPVRSGHFRLWDDLAALLLMDPELFEFRAVKGKPRLRIARSFDSAAVIEEMIEILGGGDGAAVATDHEHPYVAFHDFPTDPELFRHDLAPHVEEIIRRHGAEEWRLCVLTNELHRHLGIYSIVGAKMGLRAREILGAEHDGISILSAAGRRPPISCLNDGLQVSTGATLGHGLISAPPTDDPRPEAAFSKGGRSVRLSLKPEYRERFRADIAGGISEHGNLTPAYWAFVRRLAIQYWLELERAEIFLEVEEIPAHSPAQN